MKRVFLGRSGVRVSELSLGTMSFGNELDEAGSRAIFASARDAGINFFDCANVYAGGRSEEILGRLIQGCREEVVVATKAYFPTSEDGNARGLSRYHLRNAVEASLKRLGTDRIDVFFLHRHDDVTHPEESWRAVDDLVREGKILYPAMSNFSAWQGMKAIALCERMGWARPICFQPMYNLAKRQAEVEIFPMCESEEIAVMPYSPTGGGLLTGKYRNGREAGAGRLVDSNMYKLRYSGLFELGAKFAELSESHGFEPAALAIAWVKAHPAITSPLVGVSKTAHLESALKACEIEMTSDSELYQQISELAPKPAPATDRNEEKSKHNFGAR